MQHKSLFAALLCGALCLTACLKNEESPSVTQVRNAKAQELLSIATLNKANAEATLLLAKAEVKIKEAQAAYLDADAKYRAAEAEIRKAEAQKVLAEADLLKVQADLAKADLKLKEQELKQKEEELKALVAEYEARIAAANAEKLFWEAQMQLLEKELEAALTEAEAALWDAKLSLFESEKAYNDAIAEAEAAATEANKQAVEDLRALVEDLNARYHAAALELLDLQFDIAETNKMIAGLDAGILDATDAKYAQIEKNNKEIARLTILRDAFKGVEGKTTEELLDESANLAAALIAQLRVVSDAADAYDAAEEAFLLSIPNQVGVEADDPYYAVTYTYTQDFFVRDTDQHSFTVFPIEDDATGMINYSEWSVDEENSEVLEGLIIEDYDIENDIITVIYRENVYDGAYEDGYGWSSVDGVVKSTTDTPLYSYCPGLTEWGVRFNGTVRYPELGEGISYDARTPYMTYDDAEYIPLDINRAGYEGYVKLLNGLALNEKVDAIITEDAYIASYQEEIANRQAFIDLWEPVVTAMDEKFDEAIDAVNDAWDDVLAKRNAFSELNVAYVEKYVVGELIDRTDAWWEYQEALTAYNAAIDAYDAYVEEFEAEYGEISDLLAEKEALELYIAEREEFIASDAYTDLKTTVQIRQIAVDYAQQDYDAKKATYDAADEALKAQQKKVAKAYTAWRDARLAYFTAQEAWVKAGCPDPSDEKTAMDQADIELDEAYNTYNTENAKLPALQSAATTAYGELTTAEGNLNSANAQLEAAEANVQKPLDQIAEAKDRIDVIDALVKEFNDTLDELGDAVADAWDVVDAKILAWEALAGTTEYSDLYDAYIAYVTAYNDFWDFDKNPFFQLLYKYGVITDYTDIDYSDWTDYVDNIWMSELIWDWFGELYVAGFGEVYEDNGEYLYDVSPVAAWCLSAKYAEEIEEYEAAIEAREANKLLIEEAYEEAVAENNKLLTELDEVLANEDVYFEGVAKCNDNYAALIEAEKVYFDETIKLYEIMGNLEAVRAAYEESATIEELIAAVEKAIADLEADNEDWAAIDDATVAVNKLKETLKLTQSKAEVDAVLVESLKAELDAAVAALKATIGE